MFCEDYKVVTQTVEGGCPNHKWRNKDSKGGNGGTEGEGGGGEQSSTGEGSVKTSVSSS